MAEALPPDWRERMVDMVRGTADLDGAWFTGSPACSPEEQIGIYRNQYRLRLVDAVREETPGLSHLLGDRANDVYAAYLADHPSRTYTLNRVADRLVSWLPAQGFGSAEVDMASLDHAVQSGFEAADGRPLDVAALQAMPRLALQPHVRLLRLGHNVHALRSAILSGQAMPELQAMDVPLIVFRRERLMRHWAAPLPFWRLLAAIDAGHTVLEALEQLLADGTCTEEELASAVAGWFHDLASRQLVQVVA